MLETRIVTLPMNVRFRGITERELMLVCGPNGWAEWSPFLDYAGSELRPWWLACREWAEGPRPVVQRDRVPVNCTIPAVGPDRAHAMAAASGCRTAKIKIAEPGQSEADDLARIEAVADALGEGGRVRVDANGAWSVDEAERRLVRLAREGLEYVEQPCLAVTDLAEVRRRLARRGVEVLIAADESIRRSDDPWRVVELEAADVAVLKVQPLGGVAACLELAERLPIPVVVSSALESSVGLAAGIALAAALPELPYACGLDTGRLLAADVTDDPLVAVGGEMPVRPVGVSEQRVRELAAAPERQEFWQARLMATMGAR
ncbi:MAG: o-succinylbenzoate synthase [Propionibacteriales bacterium]|nr:o-succinylbenzoate synthase [Propionibacteriales bacterium]